MKYDGVVTRIDKLLYLFLLDTDSMEIKDGINISEHEVYKNMTDEQLMVVDVIFKDGTMELDKIDLDEFIHGDSYGENNIFIHIQDKKLISIGFKENDEKVTLKDIIDKGELNNVAIECIELIKNEQNTERDSENDESSQNN
jgi:hypothetical protein